MTITQCPNCGKVYKTKLTRKYNWMRIQDEYPNATPIEREQHLTGICSGKCWDQFLGETTWSKGK